MEPTRSPGRPRDPELDGVILDAARNLILETGYASATIGAIARRAGIGRPTIYRRWANRADLIFDALFEATETTPIPETGDLLTDLTAVARVVADDMSSPAAAQALVAVMAEVGADGDIATKVRDDTILPRVAELAVIVDRARDRGLVRRDVDAPLVFHAIAGVLYYHAAVLGRTITNQLVEDVVDMLVRGITPDETASDRIREGASG